MIYYKYPSYVICFVIWLLSLNFIEKQRIAVQIHHSFIE